MCIAVFQWTPDADTALTFASNRDEFFARPTQSMHWWLGERILAGRDEQSGGTWLGITRNARFAFVTNIRNPALRKPKPRSRGLLVSEFLATDASPHEYLHALIAKLDDYDGFNLVCGQLNKHERTLCFLNSMERAPRELVAGIYAVSNASLDTPWPKIERIKHAFAHETRNDAINEAAIDTLLRDQQTADDAALPNTGVPLDWERALSSIFIRHCEPPSYGTRASTQLRVQGARVRVRESTHTQTQIDASTLNLEFALDGIT
ncbi:MAG: NRDE family protein [Casimicrobium sp.]